jgi:hypothetical protein
MIAKSRQMAAHDFLLILFSATILSLWFWPTGIAVREVEIRQTDGRRQLYLLTADDPKLAELEYQLSQWVKPEHSAKLALSKWHAELAGLYATRTLPQKLQQSSGILPVSYHDNEPQQRQAEAREAAQHQQQHHYWLEFQRQAESAIVEEQQRQEQRLAMKTIPSITIGDLQPGPYSTHTLLFSSMIGLCTAMLFSAWTYFTPTIHLVDQAPDSLGQADTVLKDSVSRAAQTQDHLQFQLTLPATWVRLHQPAGVWIRQTAYLVLIVSVILAASNWAIAALAK